MATKIENVVQHAIRTFRKSLMKEPDVFQRDMNELKALANEISLKDVNIPNHLLHKRDVSALLGTYWSHKVGPVEYLPVYEDADVTIGVFVLKEGAKLPLHDHPCMYGILRVLQGVLNVTSYSVIETDHSSAKIASSFFYNYPLKAVKHPEVVLSERDSCCMLTPNESNIHQVKCVSGPAAFLDILSPPYEEKGSSAPRACHYFEELQSKDHNDSYSRLVQVPSPHFWDESDS